MLRGSPALSFYKTRLLLNCVLLNLAISKNCYSTGVTVSPTRVESNNPNLSGRVVMLKLELFSKSLGAGVGGI